MSNFDKAIAQILGEKVKARMSFKVRTRSSMSTSAHFSVFVSPRLVVSSDPARVSSICASLCNICCRLDTDASSQGHLDTYRFCDDVWTFILKDVKVKLDNSQQIEVEKVRIVSLLNANSASNSGKK